MSSAIVRSPVWLAADGLIPEKLRVLMRAYRTMRLGAIKANDALDDPGPEILGEIHEHGARGFADVKLADIPETNKRRARKLAGRGADIITVSATSGVAGIKAAIDGVTDERTGEVRARIYVVGVLTSMSKECQRVYGRSVAEQQRIFYTMAKEAGAHGLIGGAPDLPTAKEIGWTGEFAATAIRSAGVDANDQDRIGTPRAALAGGASSIIMGRQLVEAADPVAALAAVYDEIGFDWR